jgi:hypothetical protein
VVLGRNNPSLYTVNGRPLYVHLNGLAIVLFKEAMQARRRSRRAATDVTCPRFNNRRPTRLNQRAIWVSPRVCFGVDMQRIRWLPSLKNSARVDLDGPSPRFSFSPSASLRPQASAPSRTKASD